MSLYYIEPRTRKYVQGYRIFTFARNLFKKGKIIGYYYKNRTRCRKCTSKEIFHKIAEARGELTGDKVAEKVVKPKLVTLKILRNREEIVFYTKEKLRNTERIETKIIKCNTMKSLNYFKNQLYPSL